MARLVPPIAIVLVTLAAFHPVLGNGFVNWDDEANLTANPRYRGLEPWRLAWMFTTSHLGHYQPLTWMSFAVDYLIWGLNPAGYHLTSLLLHATNAVLLYLLIIALLRKHDLPATRWVAAACALLWAVHPLRVESVAWATERRDVLCGLFYLLSLLAYLRATEDEKARWKWLGLSLGMFALSLLSKAWGITLPLVLLAIDVFPLRRFVAGARRAVIVEKIPYAALALAAAAVAVWAVSEAGAVQPLARHGALDRALQAAYSVSFYACKTVVPVSLAPLYPLEDFKGGDPVTLLGALATVAITAALVLLRRRVPAVLTAWVCSIIILSPVLGFLQSGPQIAADRYTYVASWPWMVVLAGAFLRLLASASRPAGLVAGGMVLALGLLTFAQSLVWRDSLTLWSHLLELHPRSRVGLHSRGLAKYAAGDLEGAARDLDAALGLDPQVAVVWHSRACVKAAQGDAEGARRDFDEALRLDPQSPLFYQSRGRTKERGGDLDGAIADYTEGLRVQPRSAGLYNTRGLARHARRDIEGALADLDQAIALEPLYGEAHHSRATVRLAAGDRRGAAADLDRSLALHREQPQAWYRRGVMRREQRDPAGAIDDLTRAIRLAPAFADAYAQRSRARLAARDVAGALADASRAVELCPDHAEAFYARALARESARDPNGALDDYSQAIRHKPDFADALLNRGRLRHLRRESGAAIEDFTAAIQARPDYADAHFNRGAVLEQTGDLDGALADFAETLRLSPRDVDALHGRGRLRHAKGDLRGAIDDYTNALEIARPDWPARADVEKRLAEARRALAESP